MSGAAYQQVRDEAFRAVEAIGERHFTTEALEGCVKDFARHIYDLTDRLVLLDDVAHRAWHLMDDSGESDDPGIHIHSTLDSERLSAALDALEATGWKGCND